MASKFKVFQQDNFVWITNTQSAETNYISLQDFSFEIQDSTKTVQLIDSSLESKVESMFGGDIGDKDGVTIDADGTPENLALYLGSFVVPAGEVTIGAGSKVQIVDEDLNQVPVPKDLVNPDAKGLILMGEDSTGKLRRIRVEEDGRLISSASVVNPPNTTPIGDTIQQIVGASPIDIDTLIPLGQTIIIQTLSGGAEGDVDGSKVELWEYTDATKLVGTLLGVLYVNGSNGNLAINRAFLGDGNALITLRLSRLAGAGKEIFGVWQGYF